MTTQKWADYLIAGVWKLDGKITHVYLHKYDGGDDVGPGHKKSVADIVKLIDTEKKL